MKTTLHCDGAVFTVEYAQSGDEYTVAVNGHPLRARLLSMRDGALTVSIDGKPFSFHLAHDGSRTLVAVEGQVYEFTQEQEKQTRSRQRETRGLDPEVRSPMPGKILQVLVEAGMTVETGQSLIVLEAMKMENTLIAEGNARIKKIHVASGELVDLGQLLVELEFIQS